ncbi:MAG: tRNA (adenosine(37)-N6)-dimethylallyltransferase MiaA [Candidatus Berkelbacteria bacterium]
MIKPKNQTKIKKDLKKVVAIVGPTGSGKTKWAKHLASLFDGKLISVDSRQIYKGMDIGTAKDKSFPQDLIDVVEPAQNFSLSDYQKLATELVLKYLNLNNLPILVGGTGLYLESVVYGYEIPELKQESLKIREELEQLTDAALFSKLQELDPDSAEKIDPHNKRRVIRALEYTLLNEKPFSAQQKKKNPKFKTLIIGIDVPRETLYAKVDARVEKMIKDGLVEEVRNLIKKYPADLPALNTIGYKEIIDYLHGRTDLISAKEKIKTNTHAYIRKQDTWFRRNQDVKWVKTVEEAEKLIKKFTA